MNKIDCLAVRALLAMAIAVSFAVAAIRDRQVPAAGSRGYRVLVTNERSGTLSVIDGATRKVVATVPLGKRPRGLKVSPDRQAAVRGAERFAHRGSGCR